MTNIDWHSDSSEVLLNQKMALEEQLAVRRMLEGFSDLTGHVWVSTSGSTALKWVALSKSAILASAIAVNTHLGSNSYDIWLNPLPEFHVGGIGIIARSYLSGAKLISINDNKWDVYAFYEMACREKVTLTALVPTQVYDIISAKLTCSKEMRAVVVGGGSLDGSLYRQALSLGWRLLPSYGLTECSSQVATATLESLETGQAPVLRILPHLEVAIEDGLICVKGKSLLTGYAMETLEGPRFIDPKQNGWFHTEDMGKIENGYLHVMGRVGDFVKIGGESVDMKRLQVILDRLKVEFACVDDLVLVAVPDERLGHVVHLAATTRVREIQQLINAYHEKVLPFERIRKTHSLKSIPRTPLNKVKKTELLQAIVKSIS